MNILGIDYGKKRIGLAWVQVGLDVVLPYGIVGNIDELVELIKREGINKLVVGMPIGLDGNENDNTARVRKFAEELINKTKLPLEFVDERFSSRQADSMGGDVSRDEKSAMVILQSYLDKVKNNGN
ncbi:MAG: Holliday junction resolvase RuvX [bacterium]|nr:Holliday junction resolvase RuvX [bacterium]